MQHVGFSTDSRCTVTAAYDGTVRLWRLKLDDMIGVACQTAGRNFTPAEAKLFLETSGHANHVLTDGRDDGHAPLQSKADTIPFRGGGWYGLR